MAEFHEGICGGHYSWRATTHKILKAGFFWPKLFGDVYARVRACEKCQKFVEKHKFAPLPMIPVHIEEPFQQWGIDFIGEIHPASSGKHKWILIATDYFTKWVEAVPARNVIDAVVIKFLEDNIISRFGCHAKIVTDNAQDFKSVKFINFFQQYNIVLGHSIAYYPQGNGLAESSNKTLVRELKKAINENQKNWDSQLNFALWENRITSKRSIGKSPYELVYGRAAVFMQDCQEEPNDLTRRINQ